MHSTPRAASCAFGLDRVVSSHMQLLSPLDNILSRDSAGSYCKTLFCSVQVQVKRCYYCLPFQRAGYEYF